MKTALLLINPTSGKRTIGDKLLSVLSVFAEAGICLSVIATKYAGFAAEYVRQHAREFDMVLCAGGDGTLSECITGLLSGGHATVPLGYLPCGSTNDFAHSHGIPTDPVSAAKRIVRGRTSQIDIGEFDGKYFTYIASFGAFTAASYDAPQPLKNAIGHKAYLLEAVKELPTAIVPIRATITTARRRFRGEFVFGAVANSRSIGGVFQLKPEMVSHTDGLFELALIRYPKHIGDYYTIVKNALAFDFSDPRFRFLHTRKVHFSFEKPVDFTLDGEKFPAVREATMVVHPKAITLFR